MHRTLALALSMMLLTALVHAQEKQPPRIPAGYRVETIDTPDNVLFEVGGLTFDRNGDLLVTTRGGQVWRRHAGKWSLFADGLAETLGICVDPAGNIFVAQRPELTQLIDSDGDGKVDTFKTVNADWGLSKNYHEYCFGPVRDSQGNLYLTLNLSAGKEGSVQNSVMGHMARFRGWCVQIKPDGHMLPFANGMRSPCGLGISRDDELFYTDNQGDWNATSTLHHIRKGTFHGHPSSLRDDPRFIGRDLEKVTTAELDAMRTRPAIYIPYGEMANSPGEPTFDYTHGKFGPFAGQIIIGDQTKSNLMRVQLEKVGGEYQGCIFDFIGPTQCGIIRQVFDADGSLYIGQTQRGWSSLGNKPFGLQRVTYDGHTTPFEMHSISLTKTGFTVRFTKPVNAALACDVSNWSIKHWTYEYHAAYGCPKIDETIVNDVKVTVAPDGKSADLTLPKLVTDRVYMITLSDKFTAADGSKPSTKSGYYTLNRLRD